MNCIGSVRIEKDIHVAESVMRQPTTRNVYAPFELEFKKVLTPFAFRHVKKEADRANDVNFINIDGQFAVSGADVVNRVITSANTCECQMFTSMGLICRHLIAFKLANGLDAFDLTTCLDRWKLSHFKALTNSINTSGNANLSIVQSQQRIRKPVKNYEDKFQASKKICEILCARMAELPTNLYETAKKKLSDFVKNIDG